MATRLYLPASIENTAGYEPGIDDDWEDLIIPLYSVCRTNPINDAMADVQFLDSMTADQDVIFRQYISLPLTAGQTVTGSQAIKLQVRCSEADAANNMHVALGVRILASDASTLRKSMLSVTRDGTEAATSLVNRQFTATSAATNYTTVSGDRLIIELGMAGDPTAGGSHTSILRLGDSAASDLPEDDSSTSDLRPWIEFADTWTFDEVTFDPASGFPWPQQLEPTPHRTAMPVTATRTGGSGFAVDTPIPAVPNVLDAAHHPVPHRTFCPPPSIADGMESSLFTTVYDPAQGHSWPPQEQPVPHRRAPGWTPNFSFLVIESLFDDPGDDFDPSTGFPWPPQQEPIPHNRFVAETTSRVTGFSLDVTIPDIIRDYQQPIHHRTYCGFTPDTTQPLEPTLFNTNEIYITEFLPKHSQQEPVPHRKFEVSSLTSRISGFAIEMYNPTTFAFPWPIQQAPLPPKPRSVYLDQFSKTAIEAEFSTFDETLFPKPPQQEPVPHNRHQGNTESISGQETALLDAAAQLLWFQPQAEPLPIAKRQPYLDQYVRAPDGTELQTVFDVQQGFPWPPQSPPSRHRRYQAGGAVVAGPPPSILDTFSQIIGWIRPQQEPVAHRTFTGAATYTYTTWTETTFPDTPASLGQATAYAILVNSVYGYAELIVGVEA